MTAATIDHPTQASCSSVVLALRFLELEGGQVGHPRHGARRGAAAFGDALSPLFAGPPPSSPHHETCRTVGAACLVSWPTCLCARDPWGGRKLPCCRDHLAHEGGVYVPPIACSKMHIEREREGGREGEKEMRMEQGGGGRLRIKMSCVVRWWELNVWMRVMRGWALGGACDASDACVLAFIEIFYMLLYR